MTRCALPLPKQMGASRTGRSRLSVGERSEGLPSSEHLARLSLGLAQLDLFPELLPAVRRRGKPRSGAAGA